MRLASNLLFYSVIPVYFVFILFTLSFYAPYTDVSISCLWAKESLRFEKKTIYELTGYLSEWYGMDIRLDPSLPTDQAYTFTITHESLEEVLCLIAKITPIEYVFDEDNTVRITRK